MMNPGPVPADKGSKDKGSKIAVSVCAARDRACARDAQDGRGTKRASTGPVKGDVGEAGAGLVILRMPERGAPHDHPIAVTG